MAAIALDEVQNTSKRGAFTTSLNHKTVFNVSSKGRSLSAFRLNSLETSNSIVQVARAPRFGVFRYHYPPPTLAIYLRFLYEILMYFATILSRCIEKITISSSGTGLTDETTPNPQTRASQRNVKRSLDFEEPETQGKTTRPQAVNVHFSLFFS